MVHHLGTLDADILAVVGCEEMRDLVGNEFGTVLVENLFTFFTIKCIGFFVFDRVRWCRSRVMI